MGFSQRIEDVRRAPGTADRDDDIAVTGVQLDLLGKHPIIAEIIAKAGEFVTRVGIYPPLPDADKVQFIPMDELDEKGYADKKSEYRKLFLQ